MLKLWGKRPLEQAHEQGEGPCGPIRGGRAGSRATGPPAVKAVRSHGNLGGARVGKKWIKRRSRLMVGRSSARTAGRKAT